MYHFTFIEETSIETEDKHSEPQEQEHTQTISKVSKPENILRKTAYFLHKYLDRQNCVRIYISKN